METDVRKKGKPFGFYVCSLGFTFERMAFYTVKYLLAIWIATEVASGGLGLTDSEGAAISASFSVFSFSFSSLIAFFSASFSALLAFFSAK